MSGSISRPSYVLCDDTKLHRGAGYLFCALGFLLACWRFDVWILWGGLAAAGITALIRARRNRVLVEIGPNGIWSNGEDITDWSSFVRARITTEIVHQYRKGSNVYQILEIDHVHDGGGVYRRRLNISDAPQFNRTELMEAIAHFHGNADLLEFRGRVRSTWLDIDGDPVYHGRYR